jgi:signal transduction histidine kinase
VTRPHDERGGDLETVRASRARIVAKATGQRRDIERRLHDGIQQDLVALAVNLQLAQEAAGSDPGELERLLGEMRRDVHEAIDGVRTLARVVYPALLTDMGLVKALRGLASGAEVVFQAELPADRYAADVEAAVYFSCLDALQAIPPGAADARTTLGLWRDRESVVFEVTFARGTPLRGGALLDTVAVAVDDRIGALGGTVNVFAEAERTHIRGAIPLGRDPDGGG